MSLTVLQLVAEEPVYHTEEPEVTHVAVDLKGLVFAGPGDDGVGTYIETKGGTACTVDVGFLKFLSMLGLGIPVIGGAVDAEG